MVSNFFEVLPYRLNEKTGLIDYERLEQMALLYNPKIIIAGASAYARLYDYERISLLCEEIGAYLLADTSHIMGMIAAKSIPSPFEYCDLIMSTTHKTMRGPRGAMTFYRKGFRKESKSGKPIKYNLENRIR